MSNFMGDITAFNANVLELTDDVFTESGDEAFRSIVDGSEITGAPGQPVAPDGVPNAGKLRDSWEKERVSETEIVIATDVDYAPNVEDNLEGADFTNHGPHSGKLTAAGWPRIVDVVAARVAK